MQKQASENVRDLFVLKPYHGQWPRKVFPKAGTCTKGVTLEPIVWIKPPRRPRKCFRTGHGTNGLAQTGQPGNLLDDLGHQTVIG